MLCLRARPVHWVARESLRVGVVHGIDDRVAFQEEQDLVNKNGRPYYVMCEGNMAGPVDLTKQKPKLCCRP